MADLSKIKLNGTEYNLKDAIIRERLLEIEESLNNKVDKEKQFIITYTLNSTTLQPYEDKRYYLLTGVRDKTNEEILSAVQTGYILYALIINELEDHTYDLIPIKAASTRFIDSDWPLTGNDTLQSIQIFDTGNFSGSGRGNAYIDLNYIETPPYLTQNEYIASIVKYSGLGSIQDGTLYLPYSPEIGTDVNGKFFTGLFLFYVRGVGTLENGNEYSNLYYANTTINNIFIIQTQSYLSNITIPSTTISEAGLYFGWINLSQEFKYTKIGATSSDINNLIASAIGNINSFEVAIVTTLPTENIDTHTIYFMANDNNAYDEYMYINNNWELIGSNNIDLSGYLQTTDIADWAKAATKPTYTASEVGALPDTTVITDEKLKTTEIDNSGNAEYLLSGTATEFAETKHYTSKLRYAQNPSGATLIIGNDSNTKGSIHLYSSHSPYRTIITASSNLNNLNTITLPTTTGTIALTSDIPSVPSWALAENKPTYTAAEVGALPDTTVIPKVNVIELQKYQDSPEDIDLYYSIQTQSEIKTMLDNNEVVILSLNNEYYYGIGYDRGLSDLCFKGGFNSIMLLPYSIDGAYTNYWEKQTQISSNETDPVYSASPAASITTEKITAWDAKSDFSGSYNDLSDKPTIPTVPTNVSAFTNDSGYLTSFTETDPTVPAWAKAETKPAYTAAEVGAMATTHAANAITSTDISNWNSKTSNTGTVTSVRVQATSPVQSSTNTAQTTTLNTTISLANGYGDTKNPYGTKTANYVLAGPASGNAAVPSFRKLVAADIPAIGNITNAGDITTTATIASGDRLVINDESASKVTNSSITFGSSTTQYLANNGTWQNAYDDTALAARVTALENLEWATYYSGRSNPSNSQGQNGDIYLQY